ncbi:MAG: hypothetical protein GF332_02020 [Candidatus Moranbacteria bacterium]|nr:hypothetical protein [Candidatus Moranbacteria bacterium]
MQKNQQKMLCFALTHIIYASALYYLGLLSMDIITGGVVSRYLPISSILGAVLVASLLLSRLKTDQEQKQTGESTLGKLYNVLSFLTVLILLSALYGHSLIAAGVCAIVVWLALARLKKLILSQGASPN